MSEFYRFGRTSFSNYIWINNPNLFRNPINLNIEMSNSGAYYLEIYTPTSLFYRYRKNNPRGGWDSFYFGGEGIDDNGNLVPSLPLGDYKFKLVNAASGTRMVLQGDLTYSP